MKQPPEILDGLMIDGPSLKSAIWIYRAVNNKLRQQILFVLHRHSRMCVTDIYRFLRIDQAFASQHLTILRKSGLVRTERIGRNVFYSVNYEQLKNIHDIGYKLLNKGLH